jgi:hypothetical protein
MVITAIGFWRFLSAAIPVAAWRATIGTVGEINTDRGVRAMIKYVRPTEP